MDNGRVFYYFIRHRGVKCEEMKNILSGKKILSTITHNGLSIVIQFGTQIFYQNNSILFRKSK